MSTTDSAIAPYASGLELVDDVIWCLDGQLTDVVENALCDHPITESPDLRGLVVTGQEVSQLFGRSQRMPGQGRADGYSISGTLWKRVEPRLAATRKEGLLLPLDVIQSRFKLSPFEIECLLVCLAPDLDNKYEKLFGYLNDDVTRKFPTIYLLLRLLSPPGEAAYPYRRHLLDDAPLLRGGLLTFIEDGRTASAVSHLARCLRVEGGVVRFLLEEAGPDPELQLLWHDDPYPASARDLWEEMDVVQELRVLLDRHLNGDHGPREPFVCMLVGREGSGGRYVAEAASSSCGLGLIALDCRHLLKHERPRRLLTHAFRDSVLHASALLLANADALIEDRERATELRAVLERLVGELGWLLFLSACEAGELGRWFGRQRCVEISVPEPTREQRKQHWRYLLGTAPLGPPAREAERLAEALAVKFRLTPGQIAEAFQRAVSAGEGSNDAWNAWVELHRSAAQISSPRLGELAQRIRPVYTWDDIVLPSNRLDLLRDIVRHVQYRRKVMEEWCFERTMSRGRGLNVLFSGPPGTGKTMAAEIVANELAMDLFRIDLACVVSKYIGETEKNLARIFREAEHSDAILFFDEADALFGKRSEVHDAHDRYANIEINYLMQQMEAFEGVAVLATNLRQNMDEAFLRRIHIAVEFPLPSPEDRLRIWRKVLPVEAPCAPDVDFEFLARSFDLSGGNIRNIGLTAAYLGAERGDAIHMEDLIRATQRELEKIGKRTIREEFGPYFELLTRPPPRAGGRQAVPAGEENDGLPS